MQRRRRYAVYVSRVLSDTVVKALQSVRGDVGAVVTGERAYNALVGAAYRTEAVEWSVATWGSASAPARVAVTIAEAVGDTVARQSMRLAVIDDHFGTRLIGLALVQDRAGGRPRFDLVVRTDRWDFVLASVRRRAGPPTDTVLFDDVLFSGPTTVLRGLHATVNDPDANTLARQRAVRLVRAFAEASTQGRMSANLYRHLFLGGPAARARAVAVGVLPDGPGAARRAMAGRVAATAMGPVDTVVIAAGVPVERPRPQFSVSAADVAAHDAYIRALPARTRRALLAYTGPASGPINLALLDRFFGSGASLPSSARANVDLDADDEKNENDPLTQAALIQEALLGAPALMTSARVYKVSRFLYFGGAPRCPDGCANMDKGPTNGKQGERGTATTNYGLRAGDVERQWVFNSTTMDAWLDFGPFLDEFASCCAFAVRIPAGTRGALIIGRNSVYPNEYEVLLPYGCAFAVRQRRQASEVTYRGLAQRDHIFYQDTVVYEVDYVEPEAASPAQVDADTTRYAAQASTQGPMRIDMAKALATPAHAAAVDGHPHLARILASLLANHIEAGLALPGFADASS